MTLSVAGKKWKKIIIKESTHLSTYIQDSQAAKIPK
jgi:hypothetical protein